VRFEPMVFNLDRLKNAPPPHGTIMLSPTSAQSDSNKLSELHHQLAIEELNKYKYQVMLAHIKRFFTAPSHWIILLMLTILIIWGSLSIKGLLYR
jgi:hypothetical protein